MISPIPVAPYACLRHRLQVDFPVIGRAEEISELEALRGHVALLLLVEGLPMLRSDVLPLRVVRGVVVERLGEAGMQRADHDVRVGRAGGHVHVELLVQREARLLRLLGQREHVLPQVLHVVVEMPLLGAVRAALPDRSLCEMLLGQGRWGGEARHHYRETESFHRTSLAESARDVTVSGASRSSVYEPAPLSPSRPSRT